MNANVRAFESFAVGERAVYTRTVTAGDVDDFARLSGDDNAIHLDATFAARTRFGGRVAHGALSFGFMAAAQTRLVGAGVIWLDARVRFTAPVRIGDTVTVTTEVVGIEPERRVLHVRSTVRGRDDVVVMEGASTLKSLREAGAP